MGLEQLADQFQIRRIRDLKQHDWKITGNRIAPQARLATTVLQNDRGFGAQRRIGIDDGPGQSSIELRVRFGGVDLPEGDLIVRPCQIEDPVGEAAILVFLHQSQAGIAGLTDPGNYVDRCSLAGFQRNAAADRDDWIEHRSLRAGERRRILHRTRTGNRIPASDELRSIRFVRGVLHFLGAMHRHQVQHPRGRFARRARAAGTQNGLAMADNFGLDKKIAESWMRGVRGRRVDHHFGISGDIDTLARSR